MKVTSEQIKQHIINVVKNENEFSADSSLINEYKKQILNKANEISNNQGVDYIAKIIIDDINRNELNIEKSNFDIMKIDLTKLIEYLEYSYMRDEQSYKYLVDAIINEDDKPFMWGENCNNIINTNLLISAIVKNLHILNLVKVSEAMDNAKRRDSEKIKNAIRTLLNYTNDEQVKYYLETIKTQTRDITKSTVLSCIFCDIYKICEELFLNDINKSEVLNLSKNIMQNVFCSSKDYRPYTKIEIIEYKGYKLRMFKTPKKH